MTTTSLAIWARGLNWLMHFDESAFLDRTQYTVDRMAAIQINLSEVEARLERLEAEPHTASKSSRDNDQVVAGLLQ